MVNYRIVVRRGPQPNAAYDLNQDVIMLGRDITNDILINDVEVSRHHLRFSRSLNGYMVEDLGSTNGTFVNGRRVTGAMEIHAGDMIGLGETVTLQVEVLEHARPTTPVRRMAADSPELSQETLSADAVSEIRYTPAPTIHPARATGEALRIFISYRKTNRNRVDAIAQVLHDMGHTVTFDQDILQGQHWWNVIIEQIQQADLIIAMLSPAYLQSEPCHLEYTYAAALNKRVLPIQIEPINYRQMPVELQKIQLVDFKQQNNAAIERLSTALSILPPAMPLPAVMPRVPEAPIPEISKLKDEIINLTIQISADRQRLIAMRLYEMMRGQNAEDATMARELLGAMLKRPDITFSTGQMIQDWLNAGRPWWKRLGG
ncbi:MAG: TIR domain-containing protein [Anaerolineae bacterium]|nr:TIR domain-containing protein [Anaerolineae bacterium]